MSETPDKNKSAPGPSGPAMPAPPVVPPQISQPNVQVLRPPQSYTQKVIIAVGGSVAAVLLALLVWNTAQILILCFAGVLVAVFLSAPSELLAQHARIKRPYALLIVLLTLAVVIGGGAYLMGRTVVRQTHELVRSVPIALEKFEKQLPSMLPATDELEESSDTLPGEGTPDTIPATVSATVPARADATDSQPATAPSTQDWLAERLIAMRAAATDFLFSESFVKGAGGIVSSTFGVIGNFVIVLGVGLFFAIHPRLYSQGLVRLFPRARRPRVAFILSRVGTQLEWWFVGQLCSMASIGLLTYIGLYLLDVPMALTLAILAAMLNFIPNFGPILAAIPAVLVAFAPHDGQTDFSISAAVWVIGLYVVVQLLEGWVITPFFQQRAVELPPALIIISQVVFAVLLGPIGLILATPILAAVIVVVRMVYLEDMLGDQPEASPT